MAQAADDVAGLRDVTRAVPESIIVDESLCSVADARRLIDAEACNAFNIRVSKCGCLRNSARIARMASHVLTTTPAMSRPTIAIAVVSAALWRRANFCVL